MTCEQIDLKKFEDHLKHCPRCNPKNVQFVIFVIVVTVFFLMGFIDFPKGKQW